ncbi:iron-sulfur cluster assembly accessory protein [Gloeothece citriformis PCC 7424]|uniref:Iron-sulfur cluster assembly accessory protein n=1 Tax=Gloeothece citriformis (strain PCC 7424) TaxID=65393 RepID=B7K838_GLOC7|nr:iron-sulfur cluster assembly accessory protein [Gloeothece citriformis]ACK68526.1 iron-sulfur cluster assembly accessory protein [Gloeothece citriformis PCC 7424]
MIELTQAAANEVKRLQHSRALSNSYLRVKVQPGGCSGLYYSLELVEQLHQGDRLSPCLGINIIIDQQSEEYLKHLKLDYAEDLMGGGFRFHNPQAQETCGCGLSFTLKG